VVIVLDSDAVTVGWIVDVTDADTWLVLLPRDKELVPVADGMREGDALWVLDGPVVTEPLAEEETDAP